MDDTINNPVVTSVGNVWIVCRSKSYPDRKYYFNTYTEEAVWNLSEVEIEKAKKATKIIENAGIDMNGCPEPKDPPQDSNYNTQVNNYFNNIPIATNTKICNNKTIWENPNQTHFAPHSFSNQCYNHANTMNNIGLGYPMTCGLNPNVWNVPAQQIPDNIPSIINNSPYQMGLHHNKMGYNELPFVQSTSIPLNKRFDIQQKINDKSTNSSLATKINGDILLENGKLYKNVPTNDLRDYISRKRQIKYTKAIDKPNQLINKSRVINDKTLAISKSTNIVDGNQSDMADDNPIKQDPEQDTTLIKKNVLLHFKNIAKRILHKDLWYIVPDVNTLLYHLGFLKFLVQSDEECRLMVLENVMTDIRNASRSDNIDAMKHARRAMYYISQSIKAGVATIAKDPAAENKSKSHILDCCLNLSKENYHFILICNDEELHDHEKAAFIPMFTVNEMKSFFGTDIKVDDDWNRPTVLHRDRLTKGTVRSGYIEPSAFEVKSTDNANVNMALKMTTVRTSTETNEVLGSNKATRDVAIQANLEKKLTLTKSTQTIQTSVQTNTLRQPADSLDTTGLTKRTHIKLIRRCSQNSKKEETGNKNYKWRRKRIVLNAENNDSAKIQEQREVMDNENVSEIDNPLKQSDNLSYEDSVSNQNKCCGHIALEETSILGVSFNAQALGSDIVFSENVHGTTDNVNSEENENSNCFIFEVTSQAMDECLKTRRDEWVSRFLQIMEEVLTQLLQKDSPTNSFSPPWSVHEATQCIKMRYRENRNIVDAADKLSEILFSCSDYKGKIDMNMTPNQFMKMYSYAVYLIDCLQAVVKNSEDLHIASESMVKLLNDIQNPNLDNIHNDSFTDSTLEAALDVSVVTTSKTDLERNLPWTNRGDSAHSPRRDLRSAKNFESSPKYNLRSQRKRKNYMEDGSSSTEFFRRDDPESQFFRSLHLRKNNDSCYDDGDGKDIPENASAIIVYPAPLNNEGNGNANNEVFRKSTSEVQSTESNGRIEQRIIRNFSPCADFEAKIRSKENDLVVDGIDKVVENYGDDVVVNVENHEETNYDSDEELHDEGTTEASPIESDKFKYVISLLVRQIRETFLVVYNFCEESQRRLKGPDAASELKSVLKTAEETHFIITQLVATLNKIHNRDVTEMERLFAKFIDSAELKDLKLNENDFQEYRELIGKCIDQASFLRDSVECIMRYEI